jgi:cytoskeletal protein CcmA (bactofilin family)
MMDKLAKKSNDKPCNTIDTLIGVQTEIRGDLTFSGGLRIDGKVRGNVSARGEDNSTLVLSENAEVAGDVTVPHMIVNGRIQGNVIASERLELQPRAEIMGDVTYKVIEIAAGAVVNGIFQRTAEKPANVTRLRTAEGEDK